MAEMETLTTEQTNSESETPMAVDTVYDETVESQDNNESLPKEDSCESEESSREEKESQAQYYLLYGEEALNPQLDLAGTRDFLNKVGYDGGELRKARQCEHDSMKYSSGASSQFTCSYCGCEITGADYYKLKDGRMRCTSCSRSLVNDLQQLVAIYRRVLKNLEVFFGASINREIDLQMMDERRLKKSIGIPIGTRDEQSFLILGVAISDKNNHSIILENGSPKINVIATLAHELTHIWQNTHWSERPESVLTKKPGFFKRLFLFLFGAKRRRAGEEKSLRGYPIWVFEGMAKWAEIQYLHLVGEKNVAEREMMRTLLRKDEYGFGFLVFQERFPIIRRIATVNETPFVGNEPPFTEEEILQYDKVFEHLKKLWSEEQS